MYASNLLVDRQTGKLIERGSSIKPSDNREVVSLSSMGVRPGAEKGWGAFQDEYKSHKERNFTPEYQKMVETIGHAIAEKAAKLASQPGVLVGVPARGEKHLHTAIETLQESFSASDNHFVIVYHNDTRKPDAEVIAELDRVRKLPNVFVIDRLVSNQVNLGDIVSLIEDVAGELAYRLELPDPIYVRTDGDLRGVSKPDTFHAFLTRLRNQPLVSCLMGSYHFAPETIQSDPTYYHHTQLADAIFSFLDEHGLEWRGTVGALTGVRLNALFALGGSPKVSYGEDKLLGHKFMEVGGHFRDEFDHIISGLTIVFRKQESYRALGQFLQTLNQTSQVLEVKTLLDAFYEQTKHNTKADLLPQKLRDSLGQLIDEHFPSRVAFFPMAEGVALVDGSKDLAAYLSKTQRYESHEAFVKSRQERKPQKLRELLRKLFVSKGEKELDFEELRKHIVLDLNEALQKMRVGFNYNDRQIAPLFFELIARVREYSATHHLGLDDILDQYQFVDSTQQNT